MALATPEKWQLVAWQKKDQQYLRIPKEWLLKYSPSPALTNYLDVPRKCGILDAQDLEITEKYDATALVDSLAKGKLKSVDVVRAFCKRAAIAQQLTNCLTEILFDEALARAAHLDAHLAAGNPPVGPLHGLPISLKDTFKIPGYDATVGLAILAFKPATTASTLVDVLLNAGAVLYCKTNVPQTLMALDSHNNIFGRTINPSNTAVTPGGSSGGEGALIAMRGSVLGVGTDVGGSIRIPAMCNGLYGIKPSWQRIPFSGQESGTLPGHGKLTIPASAGPIAHTMRDLELFFSTVSDQKPWEVDPDVTPSLWLSLSTLSSKRPRIGVVRRDGLIDPLPPIQRLMDETASALRASGIEVVEIDIAPLFCQCQSLANALMGTDGGNHIFDLVEATNEPLSPWLAGRLARKAPKTIEKLQALHAKKVELENAFLKIWRDEKGPIDAFVCPVAPHPVPPIDRWNGVSYTSSFVLLDYPAGVVPGRAFEKRDMEGEMPDTKPLGSWDKVNRELWTKVDRSVYLNTALCIQVVAPKLQERRLYQAMSVIDAALRAAERTTSTLHASAKL
ncbi:amidase [Mytilinidion resinicola]|uniref:amidase n=1 Tax=Mytilinidion resinicola TaxID=574789 RepID=A0A6A6Z608_9PEZI|nr:amidase [Mytilinidion resinicola]KAF2816531.1 amidase [Mytilinidion resinicola]